MDERTPVLLEALAGQYGLDFDKVMDFLDSAAYHRLMICWNIDADSIDTVKYVGINGNAIQVSVEAEKCDCGECLKEEETNKLDQN
jgi:hypothetical protein